MTEAGPLVAWYGDDMTGSVDVLEGLMRVGIRGTLFIDAPGEAELSRLGGARAVGVAGMTRTMSGARIRAVLPPVLSRLASLGAPLLLYKICSTFDSSRDVGSIGAALETIRETLAPPFQVLLPAAPSLGRFTAFGNHFARSGGREVHRLDRHPTMRSHPVTPMAEADLRLVLAEQTDLTIGHVDLVTVGAGPAATAAALRAAVGDGAEVVLLDAVEDRQMLCLGEVLWRQATALGRAPLPVVGSAGVAHALGAHWRAGGLAGDRPGLAPAPPSGPIVAVAGSRSPVTDAQIARAVSDGFVELAPGLPELLDGDGALARRLAARAVAALGEGRDVLLHSAGGPLARGRAPVALDDRARRRVGGRLGAVCEEILRAGPVERVAIAGGDTSGDVARRLGVAAVEAVAPFGPAMPLCRMSAPGRPADDVEVVFKGGQTGTPDFFSEVRQGISAIERSSTE